MREILVVPPSERGQSVAARLQQIRSRLDAAQDDLAAIAAEMECAPVAAGVCGASWAVCTLASGLPWTSLRRRDLVPVLRLLRLRPDRR